MPSLAVLCECGKVVPVYLYCDGCKRVSGSPSCPCGRPLKGVRNWRCPGCVPSLADIVSAEIRSIYYRKTGLCESGTCCIPTCRSCGKADAPEVSCPVCHKIECSNCSRFCVKAASEPKSKKPDSTVTYSGNGSRYTKGADKDRPRMFVEAWYYKAGRLVNRTLVGFKKEA